MLNLLWPDGSLITADTWRELEDALRATQWSTFKSRRSFRREMRRRAAEWSGRKLKPVGIQSSREFIMSLVHADMCTLVIDEDDTITTEKGSAS